MKAKLSDWIMILAIAVLLITLITGCNETQRKPVMAKATDNWIIRYGDGHESNQTFHIVQLDQLGVKRYEKVGEVLTEMQGRINQLEMGHVGKNSHKKLLNN